MMLDTIDRPHKLLPVGVKKSVSTDNTSNLVSGSHHQPTPISPTSASEVMGTSVEPNSSVLRETQPSMVNQSAITAAVEANTGASGNNNNKQQRRSRRSNSDIPHTFTTSGFDTGGVPEGYPRAGGHHMIYHPYPPAYGHPPLPHPAHHNHYSVPFAPGQQQQQHYPPSYPIHQQPHHHMAHPHHHQQQMQHQRYPHPGPPQPMMGSSYGHYVGSPGGHPSYHPRSSGAPAPTALGTSPSQQQHRSSLPPPSYFGKGPPPLPTTTTHRTGTTTTTTIVGEDRSNDESQPLLQAASTALSPTNAERTRKVSREQRSRRRKALSSSAADPNYGAFWQGEPPPSQALQQQQLGDVLNNNGRSRMTTKFSPRAEFRKLAQGLSPTASPAGGAGRKVAPPQHVRHGSGGGTWPAAHGPPPPPPPIPAEFFQSGSMDDSRLMGGGHYQQQMQQFGAAHQFHPLMHMSERPQYQHSGPSGRLARAGSLRKMHIRQESAQIMVQEYKGVEQPLMCRNVLFLLLFVFHLLFIAYLGEKLGSHAMTKDHGNTTEGDPLSINYSNLVYIACWSGLFAVFISGLLLGAMTYFARHFVQIALFVIIFLSFAWGTIGIGLSPKTAVPVTGIIALALAVAYTFIVWDRIPFAAANLVTALSGIRDFPGIIVVAFGLQAIALAWSIGFSVVVFSVYNDMQERGTSPRLAYCVYVLLAISLNWTFQVLQGTVHAITAGVIGGWWYNGRTDDNKGLVGESAFKTVFYSMGSICFGSLFVGPVGILRLFSVLFRPSSTESSSLMCLHECVHCIQSCMTSFVDSITASCNTWAFTYIGMYHYGFLDAGRTATELFEKRGWSTIVTDDLVPNVLFFTSLVIGGITGCFAYLLSQIDRLAVVNPKDEAGLAPFVEGVIIGLVLPSVVFGLISSSVNAVLVCFAASPYDFERRHPQLSHEMQSAWREVWPGALDVSRDRFGA